MSNIQIVAISPIPRSISLNGNKKGFLRHCFEFKQKSDDRICKYCGTTVKNKHYDVLISHLKNCSKVPTDIRRKLNDRKRRKIHNHHSNRSVSSNSSTEDQRFLTHEDIDTLMAYFVFESGIPANIIDGNSWKRFIGMLIPGYTSKSPSHLMKTELPKLYEIEKKKVMT